MDEEKDGKRPLPEPLPPELDPQITGSFKRTFNSWLLSKERMKLAAQARAARGPRPYRAAGAVSAALLVVVEWHHVWTLLIGS